MLCGRIQNNFDDLSKFIHINLISSGIGSSNTIKAVDDISALIYCHSLFSNYRFFHNTSDFIFFWQKCSFSVILFLVYAVENYAAWLDTTKCVVCLFCKVFLNDLILWEKRHIIEGLNIIRYGLKPLNNVSFLPYSFLLLQISSVFVVHHLCSNLQGFHEYLKVCHECKCSKLELNTIEQSFF